MLESMTPAENEKIALETFNIPNLKVPFTLLRAAKFPEYNDILEQEKIAKVFDCVNRFALDDLKFFLPQSANPRNDPFLAYFTPFLD
jgi:hypothetical protein